MVWCKKPGLFLCTWIIRGPNTIYWKRLFLFTLHGIALTSCQNQLSITIRVYFWIPHSFLLICMSIFMTISHYLGYCIFIVSFEFGKYKCSTFFLFQDCFGYSGPLDFHMNFMMNLPDSAKTKQNKTKTQRKNLLRILGGLMLNL